MPFLTLAMYAKRLEDIYIDFMAVVSWVSAVSIANSTRLDITSL